MYMPCQAWRNPKVEPVLWERYGKFASTTAAGVEWLGWIYPCLARLIMQHRDPHSSAKSDAELLERCQVEKLLTREAVESRWSKP
jgi:hypothetical protein